MSKDFLETLDSLSMDHSAASLAATQAGMKFAIAHNIPASATPNSSKNTF